MADDDEDRWLYGDSSETAETDESDKDKAVKAADQTKEADATVTGDTPSKVPPPTLTSPTVKKAPSDVAAPQTDGQPQDGTAEDEDSDEDSEDDDVQITIGDIKSGPPSFPPYSAMKLSAYRKTNTTPSSSNTSVTVLPPKPEKTLDLEAEGTINGVGVYSFDLESVQEKPWNKPGADITDYFNYGLNEETWKIYSEKQRKLRMEHKITVHHAGFKDSTVPPGEESVKSIPPSSSAPSWNDRQKKPFTRNMNQHGSGAISVIGSSISTISGRRDSDTGIKFNGSAVVSSSNIGTVQTGAPLVSMQRTPPSTIPTMHSGPPPGSIPVMQMSQPPPNMGQPPPGFGAPPLQQTPAYHSGPPPQQAPYMPPMNRPPPIMNRPPPPAFNNAMPPPPMRGINLGPPPPAGIPPPVSVPSRLPPPVSAAPPRMPGPPPPPQGDNWNRPPFYPNANAPHFTPSAPSTPMQGPGHGPAPSPSPGPGPPGPPGGPPGPPGGPAWDRPVSGFPSFQDQWSPRAGSEESDISSGSDDYKRSPKGATPTRRSESDERREYRSRDRERSRDKERRGRYTKDSSRERDKKHRERSHDRDKERDRKSRDKEDRHRKRKDRDDDRSDGHRSSRHKRSKHSHRDSEKEDRSSSHGREDTGKDLVIADTV